MSSKIITLLSNNNDTNSTEKYFFNFKELFDIGNEKRINMLSNRFLLRTSQRFYDWNKRNILEYFKDIDESNDNSPHFIGTIYLGNNHNIQQNIQIPIVDGQQRMLTTLLILNELDVQNDIKISLWDSESSDETKQVIEIFPSANDFLNNPSAKNLIKQYDSAFTKNKKIIRDKLNTFSLEQKENFKKNLLNNIVFMIVKAGDDKIEDELFTNLNSKGSKLDDIDNIKALLVKNMKAHDFHVKYGNIAKKGKKSIKKFLSTLQHSLFKDSSISGAPKYVNFLKKCDEDINIVIQLFEKHYEEFSWNELDEKEMFNHESCHNQQKSWKSYQICVFLAKKCGWTQKIEGELRTNFANYSSDKEWKNSIRLFMLFFISFFTEANKSYSGTQGQNLLDKFLVMNEAERKKELARLWKLYIDENVDVGSAKLLELSYSDASKKHILCLLLLLSLQNYSGDYITSLYSIFVENYKKDLDHIIPKKPKLPSSIKPKKPAKDFKIYFNSNKYPSWITENINKIYNLQLLDSATNQNWSNIIDSQYYIYNSKNEVENLNYQKIEQDMKENFDNIKDRLKNLVESLI